MERIDMLIENVKVFNSYLKKFINANVAILDGYIYYIDKNKDTDFETTIEIDGTNKFMIPGLIDIHMHIESSMMTPEPFCNHLAACGVTTIVAEPHEMANVKGMEAVYHMIHAGENAAIDVFYGIPSSVPSTSKELETTGGIIGFEEMKRLKEEKQVICVGEVMNYRGVIQKNELEISKFLNYIRENDPNYVIEGHCPKLMNLDLAKFLYLGINGDHTEHSLEEMKQRFENGMFVELQTKMLDKNIFDYISENNLYEYMSFVTDDTMADELYTEGQLNAVLKQAVKQGFPIEYAIYCSSFTPAARMNLRDRGTIAPGKKADFVLLENLELFLITHTFKNGRCIYNKEAKRQDNLKSSYRFPFDYYKSVIVKELALEDFQISISEETERVLVKVMEISDGSTQTKKRELYMPVQENSLCWEESGCLLAMVFERHGINGNISYGFITGDGLKRGAVATTYFHDHHNLFVTGSNREDMLIAANRIKELQGGFVVVDHGRILAELPLQVCGILSEEPVKEVGCALKQIRDAMIELGYDHYNPIMSLCTLGLPVSPHLKLTDVGLVDVQSGEIVPLYTVSCR